MKDKKHLCPECGAKIADYYCQICGWEYTEDEDLLWRKESEEILFI